MISLVIGDDTRVAGYRSGVEIKVVSTGTPAVNENDGRAGMAVGFILQFDAICGDYAADWQGCDIDGPISSFGGGYTSGGLLFLLSRLH